MKKILLTILFALLLSTTTSWGQAIGGSEDFTNYPETSSTYKSGSFTGNDGSTWTYLSCRGDKRINNETPCLAKGVSPAASIYSGTISGGCGTLSFNYMQAFTTNVNLEVFINDTKVTTITTSGETGTVKSSGSIGVNITGDFVIKFIQSNTSAGQISIDDITWNGYSASGNQSPIISNISQNPTSGISSTTTVSVSADATDSDGTISSIELRWGTTSGSLGHTITMTNGGNGDTYTTSSVIPAQEAATTVYYQIYAVDNESGTKTSAELNYSVLKDEPSNHVTQQSATANSYSQITVYWTDATGSTTPDGYLVKAAVSPSTPTSPADGVSEADAALVKNINPTTGEAIFSGLSAGVNYNFSIWPYTNSGSNINYKTDETIPSTTATTSAYAGPTAWINEFHYDNDGTDAGEFIEIVVKDVSNYTLSNFRIDLYNGGNGASYDNVTLASATEITEGNTEGNFTFYKWTVVQQNGSPDGVALSYNGTLIPEQFLSYEGTFTATNGVANGLNSTDIGVREAGDATSPPGFSLQLSGYGTVYSDFYWIGSSDDNPDSLNYKQILSAAPNIATWTGSSNNDWFTNSNWREGQYPGRTTSVIITDVDNQPTISEATRIGSLTVHSDATLLGTEKLSISGSTLVKRDLSIGRWQYLTPPVSGATANDVEIISSEGDAYVASYNNNVTGSGSDLSLGWNYLTDDTDALSAGSGYGVWVTSAKEIEFNGTLLTGNQTISGLSKGDSGNNAWVFIGNSALAHLDWTLVGNDADITPFAHLYDPDFGGDHYGTIAQDGTKVNTGSNFIPPMQGFFVEVDGTPDDNSITFPISALTHNGQAFYKSETIRNNFVRLAIQKENYSDETVIFFKDDAENGYQAKTDAHKLMIYNEGTPQLYTVADDQKLTINTLNNWPADVPINIHNSISEELTLTALEVINLDPDIKVLLEDMQTGIIQNLLDQPEYSFSASSGENNDRFVLHFTSNALDIDQHLNSSKIFYYNQKITIERSNSDASSIEIYNLSGQLLNRKKIVSTKTEIETQLPNGIYLIKLQDQRYATVLKITVNN